MKTTSRVRSLLIAMTMLFVSVSKAEFYNVSNAETSYIPMFEVYDVSATTNDQNNVVFAIAGASRRIRLRIDQPLPTGTSYNGIRGLSEWKILDQIINFDTSGTGSIAAFRYGKNGYGVVATVKTDLYVFRVDESGKWLPPVLINRLRQNQQKLSVVANDSELRVYAKIQGYELYHQYRVSLVNNGVQGPYAGYYYPTMAAVAIDDQRDLFLHDLNVSEFATEGVARLMHMHTSLGLDVGPVRGFYPAERWSSPTPLLMSSGTQKDLAVFFSKLELAGTKSARIGMYVHVGPMALPESIGGRGAYSISYNKVKTASVYFDNGRTEPYRTDPSAVEMPSRMDGIKEVMVYGLVRKDASGPNVADTVVAQHVTIKP